MLGQLLEKHNIKYIISVDDCYANINLSEIKSQLYADLIKNFLIGKNYLIGIGKKQIVETFETLCDVGTEIDVAITTLISGLSDDEIRNCYNLYHSTTDTESDKEIILKLLKDLKENGNINDFLTFSSVHEANNIDLTNFSDGSILWLIDKNFQLSNESEEAGFELAKNIVNDKDTATNYVYILTSKDMGSNEQDIESEIDVAFKTYSETKSSFVYYISKSDLVSASPKRNDKLAKSLVRGFKRKVCFEIFQILRGCLTDGTELAYEDISQIKQQIFDYLLEKVKKNGESYQDFVARLVNIFYQNKFHKLFSKKYKCISEKIYQYNDLSKICNYNGNDAEIVQAVKRIRQLELYNENINIIHSEIAPGDIFKIGEKYFILATQACDTYLRSDGKRKLNKAILLAIKFKEDGNKSENDFTLNCFCDKDYSSVLISFHDNLSLPFEILDLCVLNDNGQSSIDETLLLSKYDLTNVFSNNFKSRFEIIKLQLLKLYKNRKILDEYIENASGENKEIIQESYVQFLKLSPCSNFSYSNSSLVFPIRRVSRLDELTLIDILSRYSDILSRIGHPFDYS